MQMTLDAARMFFLRPPRAPAPRAFWMVALVLAVGLAGCAGDGADPGPVDTADAAPFLGYSPVEPDAAMVFDMFDVFTEGSTGNILHGRVVMPTGDGPFATIVQHTPYTAPGCNTWNEYDVVPVEPPVVGHCYPGMYEYEFVRRGYVYVHADLRGTGDSNGCVNLRGQADIDDIGALADAIAAQSWSNGNVGFIGVSYPGSTSHMAAMSGSPAVKAVIPMAASTSFYHYHHNDGVPYRGQHSLGGTNAGYTREGVNPTYNPTSALAKLVNQPLCPHVENAVMHGGLDQTGDYYAWWQDRNLRTGAKDITTPVLMAQGLSDWNVKPDHIATWFNDLNSSSKTFIGGQWGHASPRSDDGACPDDYKGDACEVPWGDWWAYAVAFFDTFLKEIDTGMFNGSLAWVQDNNGTWHRSTTFPLQGDEAAGTTLYVNKGGLEFEPALEGEVSWNACPRGSYTMGMLALADAEPMVVQCENTQVVFESKAFAQEMRLSGVPLLHLTLDTQGLATHIVAVLDVIDESGNVIRARENYGYLNTRFHAGFPNDSAVPSGFFNTTLDFYPQEDLIKAGERLRLTLRSHDEGRTIEYFEEGEITAKVGGEDGSALFLPLRPEHMMGVRLD